jgi:Tfp pilus assembly protein PilP
MKWITLFIILASLNLFAQDKKSAAEYIEGATSIKEPFALRDPFKPPKLKKTIKKKQESGIVKDGVFTNLATHEKLKIDDIRVVGVVIGKNRRAMIKTEDKKQGTLLLKEGMKIDSGRSELKAILPGGVVFVEKITNVYGQDEYLETVVPISRE